VLKGPGPGCRNKRWCPIPSTLAQSQPAKLTRAAKAIDVAGAPKPADTPVAIWNASKVDGAANRLKIRLAGLGYPAVAAKSRSLPKGGLKGTWIFYTPGNEPAANQVALNLGAHANRSVRPLDGISPERIAPAVVLVVVGR
jgi:hypothetical protein